ncbi:DnaJ-domain-containing protein [Agrocybe pediades]|nr:DnaJ-domain-containing protein [Agrocybe pediades]
MYTLFSPECHCANVDYYQLLAVRKDASQADIKSAYHRALLQSHPDKQRASPTTDGAGTDIALIKEAYTVLSNLESRKSYDEHVDRRSYTVKAPPRPAQVISLEEFEDESASSAKVAGQEPDDQEGPWRYPCRCGGCYRITVALMEKGEHLVACNDCSEVVWVGYELVD